MLIEEDSIDQESVLGLYTSTEARLEVPSSPPTTYNNPFKATTPKTKLQ